MKTRSEITKTVSLMAETDTLSDAMVFVLEAADELGDEVNVEVQFRISHGEENERDVYYGVKVIGKTISPAHLGNDNE